MSFFWLTLLSAVASAAKYDQYILAPSSRTIYPSLLYHVNGTVDGAASLASSGGSATFHDWSSATFDYGKDIGGVVTFTVGAVSDANQFIGITFSESSQWISGNWSDATNDAGNDEPLWFHVTGPGDYTAPAQNLRGGFKYLSVVHNTTGTAQVTKVSVHYTSVPHFAEDQLRNYTGYFHSNDDLINRIWYAGAYTAQLCTIDPHYGNSLNFLGVLTSNETIDGTVQWWSNTTIANASSVLADGAKRDRLVWPGDMVSSWPTILSSTNDKVTVTNSLDSLFARQNQTTGILPYAGVPFPFTYSPTYHLHNLIGAAQIYVYDGDITWISGKWEQWKKGMAFSLSQIDSSGLFNASSSADWLRFGMGGHNIEANAILYFTLNYGLVLAEALNDTSVIATYQNAAASIKTNANAKLYDANATLFKDNETTTLHPQDGNVWAVLSNLTDSSEKAAAISSALVARWGKYGAPAPEAGATVSPFVGGFELQAHAAAGNTTALLALCRLQWGFMLDDPRMTNSTFIEGYSTDGSLHYAPYTNDPRISYSHGWSTGPTSALSFYVAGIQILTSGGSTWKIAPRLGDLTSVDAGLSTSLGVFSANTNVTATSVSIDFEAPLGTTGTVSIEAPNCSGRVTVTETQGRCDGLDQDHVHGYGWGGHRWGSQPWGQPAAANGTIEIVGLQGGQWSLRFQCDSV